MLATTISISVWGSNSHHGSRLIALETNTDTTANPDTKTDNNSTSKSLNSTATTPSDNPSLNQPKSTTADKTSATTQSTAPRPIPSIADKPPIVIQASSEKTSVASTPKSGFKGWLTQQTLQNLFQLKESFWSVIPLNTVLWIIFAVITILLYFLKLKSFANRCSLLVWYFLVFTLVEF